METETSLFKNDFFLLIYSLPCMVPKSRGKICSAIFMVDVVCYIQQARYSSQRSVSVHTVLQRVTRFSAISLILVSLAVRLLSCWTSCLASS